MSFTEAEVSNLQLHVGIPGISHKSVLGLAGSCTAPSALSLHSSPHGGFMTTKCCLLLLFSDLMAESPYFMAPSSWLPPYSLGPYGTIVREAKVALLSLQTAWQNLSACPYLKC